MIHRGGAGENAVESARGGGATNDEGWFRVEGVTLGKARVTAGRAYGCVYYAVDGEVDLREGQTAIVQLRAR